MAADDVDARLLYEQGQGQLYTAELDPLSLWSFSSDESRDAVAKLGAAKVFVRGGNLVGKSELLRCGGRLVVSAARDARRSAAAVDAEAARRHDLRAGHDGAAALDRPRADADARAVAASRVVDESERGRGVERANPAARERLGR